MARPASSKSRTTVISDTGRVLASFWRMVFSSLADERERERGQISRTGRSSDMGQSPMASKVFSPSVLEVV